MNSLVIGVSGVAGAGKDTFAAVLEKLLEKKGFSVQRFALADCLKNEVSSFSIKSYGIDPLNCSREEKELIRPILVAHGCLKRRNSKGRYWINKLNSKISNRNKFNNKISIITDIRFSDFENDETHWVQNELRGVLVHVSLYEKMFANPHSPDMYHIIYKQPANAEEERSNPLLLNKANYKLEWELRKGSQDYILQELIPYGEKFITWLFESNRLNAGTKNKGNKL